MKSTWNEENIQNIENKTIIITGATSGLGLNATKILLSKGANVIMGVRNLQKAQAVMDQLNQFSDQLSAYHLDNMDLDSVDTFVNEVSQNHQVIDVLINNAGIMMVPYATSKQGYESQIATNHLAHFKLTGKLLPLLQKSTDGRVVTVASGAQSFGHKSLVDDLNFEHRKYNKNRAYGNSKLANMLFTNHLSIKLEGTNVKVVAAHPGWSETPLQDGTWLKRLNRFFAMPAEQGCLPILYAAVSDEVKNGEYYGPETKGIKQGYPIVDQGVKLAYDQDLAQKLWDLSQTLTGITY